MLLVILPVLSFATIIPLALVLIILGTQIVVHGIPHAPVVDADEMAAQVVRKVAARKIYKSDNLRVVPVIGRPGAFHVVTRQGRREQIAVAASLAVVHTLVIAHFAH